jgi:RNA methyltransferase, TrmH family
VNVPLKKYRKEFRHSYAFGISPTLELLHRRPSAALGVMASARADRSPMARQIRRLCDQLGLEFRTDDACVARLGCKEDCMTVGVFRKYVGRLDPGANHVVLDRPQYSGNVGTIARTMIGFGFANLAVIRPAAQVLDPECVRSSMGAVFSTTFEYFDSFDAYVGAHHREIHPFVVGGGTAPEEVRFLPPVSLLFGNEGTGLPEELCRCGRSVTIPHSRAVDSLNIAVAVGIALYQVSRWTQCHAISR